MQIYFYIQFSTEERNVHVKTKHEYKNKLMLN